MWKVPNKVIAAIVIIVTIIEIITIINIRYEQLPKSASVNARATIETTGIMRIEIRAPCSITLVQGWNFISLCNNVTNNSINSVLSGTGFSFVLQWNESSQSFDIFSASASTNSFETMLENKSYFVFVPGSGSTISPSGSEFGDMNISLLQGWNAPTYPYPFSANISRYLDQLSSFQFMLKWNSSGQAYIIYSRNSATNPFSRIDNGEGQFLHLTSSQILRYNKTDLQSS